MTEKPILFNSEMVRAILDGRKTQTRRVVKPQPPLDEHGDLDCGRILGPEMYHPQVIGKSGEFEPGEAVYGVYDDNGEWGVKCPYGRPGDKLWVRETWAVAECYNSTKPSDLPLGARNVDYRADEPKIYMTPRGKWRPSIHMPRWASRITLKVTVVRVERLWEMSEYDMNAEGVASPGDDEGIHHITPFVKLWDSINKKRGYGWDTNPWVWVVTSEHIKERL